MKTRIYGKQQGAMTVLSAVVLLIAVTMVVLFTSKTVFMETKMTADSNRTAQANAAAQAAMDRGVAYFGQSSIDLDRSKTVDYITPQAAQMPSATNCVATANVINNTAFTEKMTASKSNFSMFYFVNTSTYDHDNDSTTAAVTNPCECAAGNCLSPTNMNKALIVAKGWSDDCSAVRTIMQCMGSFSTLKVDPNTGGSGVPAPVVGVSSVGLKGNASLVNRFTQSNIWAGDPNYTVSGQSMQTFLRKSGTQVSDFTLHQLIAEVPQNGDLDSESVGGQLLSQFTQVSSTNKSGNGVDIIVGDNTLAKVEFETFFTMSLSDAISLAESEGECYTSGSTISSPAQACTGGSSIPTECTEVDPASPTGCDEGRFIVADESASLPTTLGSIDDAVILVINGDLHLTGTHKIYGFVFVTGQLHIGGQVKIIGSVLSQDPDPPSGTGSGTPQVIYRPLGGDLKTSDGEDAGYDISKFVKKGIISGSWRDW